MSLLVALTSFLVACPIVSVPQGTPQEAAAGAKPAQLSAAEHSNLRDKLAKYLADDTAHEQASGEQRKKTGRAREKSKQAFETEWDKFDKKFKLLASTNDLRAIFDNCFLVKAPTFSLGQLRKETIKEEGLDYSFYLPKGYKADKAMRTVLVLPGVGDAAGKWTKAADHWAATWDQSAASADTIFHIPHVPEGVELDLIPDYNREGAEEEDRRRIKIVFGTLGEVWRSCNVDRNRLFLDLGRGTCGFGLRFMSMFPDRFAGAVLRQPVAVDDLRLGCLLGMPLLLLRTPETAQVVDALKAKLDAVAPGQNLTTVIDATDAYPHKASTPAIEEWLGKQRRTLVPTKVVIEPNHDMYNDAYWAKIDTADSLLTTAADKKPRLEVQADRASNRITVKALGIERFTLYLNDDLVDLDKEFTVVINDKAQVEKRTRTFRELREGVKSRFDGEFLFPARFSTAVPK